MATSSRYRFDAAEAAGALPPYTRRLVDVARTLARPILPGPGRAQSPETRAKLSAATFTRRRAEALARADLHPLQRARLTVHGTGWTIERLAASAIVAPAVIEAAEAGQPISNNSWHRLARALDLPPETIKP